MADAPTRIPSRTLRIHGPIVCSGDLPAHLRLFGAFGLREAGRAWRPAEESLALWGVAARCEEVTLSTPGTPFGIRLVAFDPPGARIIRDPARGYDSEALKVIDFYAPDLPAAKSAVEAAGFRFKEDIADYETPEGRFQEAHLWGPDGVVCALVSCDPAFFRGFATVTDRLVSEPQSISGPVQDAAATLSFFREVLELSPIHTYGIHEDESFQTLVGAPSAFSLRAWNVGVDRREPYFGIIDYGLKDGSQVSLRAAARPPSRGLVGATVVVRDVQACVEAAGSGAISAPRVADIPGFGAVRVASLSAPNGAWLQLVEGA